LHSHQQRLFNPLMDATVRENAFLKTRLQAELFNDDTGSYSSMAQIRYIRKIHLLHSSLLI